MLSQKRTVVVLVLINCLLLSSCGPGQAFGPTTTPSPTVTNTPQPTATITPLPTATFPVSSMSNPSLNVIDIKVTVKGEMVTAVFYLQDVPETLAFYRTGILQNRQEYAWQVFINTDNDLNTGYVAGVPWVGLDYSLSAISFIGPQINKGSFPIEKGVQVNVWLLSGNTSTTSTQENINVDPEANTITISGTIPGVTANSKFFFSTYDANPDGQLETTFGQITDRVSFIE
ncbi:MAG: hypothetical protein NTZ74_14430 [Chloroflexi bacterium]|nr:hypothetical protein [Chloroflexota bacterium]